MASQAIPPAVLPRDAGSLPHHKLWLIAILAFALEYVALALFPHKWFTFHLFRGAPAVFGLALLFFGLPPLRRFAAEGLGFRWGIAATHVLALGLLLAVQVDLLRRHAGVHPEWSRPLEALWLVLLPVVALTLLASFTTLRHAGSAARALGAAWGYALACAVLIAWIRLKLQIGWDTSSLYGWQWLQQASFHQTHALLKLFYPVVVADPATHTLGTNHFRINLAGACSGIEGLALISVFALAWMVFARRELRLFRAMLLLPVALLLMWAFNLLRLVVLIAIGNAGHPDIAINGFHAQAGWICFNVVALGFLFTAQHIAWFRRGNGLAGTAPWSPPMRGAALRPGLNTLDSANTLDSLNTPGSLDRPPEDVPGQNAAAIYLAPFLAILAASLVSQSASSGFEWMYPLRFLAALAALWYFRQDYAAMDWRCGLLGPLAGVAIAGMWLAAHFPGGLGAGHVPLGEISKQLAAFPLPMRLLWIAVRVLTAVLVVPVAEELAFRGFLARRIMSPEVEAVPYSRLGVASILLSSLAFGLMHGRMWLPGFITGIVFALVARRRGRLGEAVGAHIAANFVIALAAVSLGDYSLWS